MYEGQSTTCEKGLSPSTLQIPGIEISGRRAWQQAPVPTEPAPPPHTQRSEYSLCSGRSSEPSARPYVLRADIAEDC